MEHVVIESLERTSIESLVKARVVGARLGMATSQVYRLARSGRSPSYVVGAKGSGIRFDLTEVKAALRRTPQAASAEGK